MGIDADTSENDRLDLGLLRAPKEILLAIYAISILRCGWSIYFNEMYQEEFFILLIYIGIMLPLLGFIAVNHRWAMSSAFAVYLCYLISRFLFVESMISLFSLGFVIFLGAMTWRAILTVDLIKSHRVSIKAEVFE